MINFRSIQKGYNLDITYYKVMLDEEKYVIFAKFKDSNEVYVHKRNVDIDLVTWYFFENLINAMEEKQL